MIKLTRDAEAFPDSHDATVEPEDVEAWTAEGWSVVEDEAEGDDDDDDDDKGDPAARVDALRAQIVALGGKPHHLAGEASLTALLDGLLVAPHQDANGLSIRELDADLESLGLEIDPADKPADKWAKIQTARAGAPAAEAV